MSTIQGGAEDAVVEDSYSDHGPDKQGCLEAKKCALGCQRDRSCMNNNGTELYEEVESVVLAAHDLRLFLVERPSEAAM